MFSSYRIYLICLLLLPLGGYAQSVKVNEEELNYEILDIKLKGTLLYQSADFLSTSDGAILGSVDLLSALLEINLTYNNTTQRFEGNFSNIEVNASLEELSKNLSGITYWSETSFGYYFDLNLLAELFNANFRLNYNTLSLQITPNQAGFLFPIEIKKQRERRSITDLTQNKIHYDFLIEDQYRLFTPPKGQVDVTLDGNESGSTAKASLGLYGDVLYHSTNLNLNVNSEDSDVTGRLKFSRDQTSPNNRILGVLNNYSFGDVSNKLTRFGIPISGLGVSVSTVDKRFVNYYGKTTIEEDVPANWQVELYRYGFLIAIETSTEDGRVTFENLDVDYGTNRFVLKMYGPYGETENRNVDVVVGSQIIKQGNVDFSVNIVDQSKSVFDNNNQDSSYDPSINIQTNLGLGAETSVGIAYLSQSLPNTEDRDELVMLSVSKSLTNSLLDLSATFEDDSDYNYNANLIGSIGQHGRYRLNAESTKNETSTNSLLGTYYSTRLENFSLSFSANFAQREFLTETIDTQNYSIGLARNILGSNVTHTLRHNSSNSNEQEETDGELAISRNFFNSLLSSRLSLAYAVNNSVNRDAGVQSGTFSLNWRNTGNLNGAFDVKVFKGDEYQVTNRLAWRNKRFHLTSNLTYSNENKWSVGIGISFNLDYDYYKNKMNIQSEYSAASATLDMFTYKDRNKSGSFDEWDSALEGVVFGTAPYWQNLPTNNKGYTYLPSPLTGRPFKISYDTTDTESDLLSPVYDKVYFFTHPGGVVSFDVPFNYNSYVDGYVLNSSNKGVPGNIPLQLLNRNNKVIKEFTSDFNNSYSLENIWPGKYKIQIAPSFLEQLDLASVPEVINFKIEPKTNAIELDDFELVDKKVATQIQFSQLNSSEFFTIQFGAYNSDEYCALRVEQLKTSGYQDAFYSMATNTCKVFIGEYKSEKSANDVLISMPKELVQDGFATIFRAGDDIYAINISSFSVQLSAVTKKKDCNIDSFNKLAKETDGMYVLETETHCKLYLGDFASAKNARKKLNSLPSSLRDKGAFIVKH